MAERFFKVTVFSNELDLDACPDDLLEYYTRIEYVELEEVADVMNIEPEDFDDTSEEEKNEYFDNYAYNMAWGEVADDVESYDWRWEEVSEDEVNQYYSS